MKQKYKPVVLLILDGWGESEEITGNAVKNAKLPTINDLNHYYPKTLLQASGLTVGLPWLQYGNSEVGHQTMGTGQILYQNLPRITASIGNGEFFKNEVLLEGFKKVKNNNSKLHILGLVSDGGVHSHIDHLLALLELVKKQELSSQTYIHAITDGRDTPPSSSLGYIAKVMEAGIGRIATVSGRYYAMDRNNNWDRIEKAVKAMVSGEGIKEKDALEAITKQHKNNVTDEYIEPIILTDENSQPVGQIKDNDVIIFINFRKDRARQITQAFIDKDFHQFKETTLPKNISFICMTEYDKKFKAKVAFEPQVIKQRVGEMISKNNLRQLRLAETEKYAHVTYFFNGGREKPYQGEDQFLIPSKNIPSYAEMPEMSAKEITEKLVEAINSEKYDFILVNYANPDMVGHTGDFKAGIKACEVVDKCLDRVINKVLEKKGCLIITADHGNVEEMINLKTGEMDTQHSSNPVPCWLVTPTNRKEKAAKDIDNLSVSGMLIDITPTILDLLNLDFKKAPGIIGTSILKII